MKSCPSPCPSQPAIPSTGTVGNKGQVLWAALRLRPAACPAPGPHTAWGVEWGREGRLDRTPRPLPLSLSPCLSREGASRQRCQPEGRGPRSPGHGARPTCSPLWCVGTRDLDVVDASWFGWFFCCLDLNIFFCFVFCFVIFFLFVFLFLPFAVQGRSFHYNRNRKAALAVSRKHLQARREDRGPRARRAGHGGGHRAVLRAEVGRGLAGSAGGVRAG